jgi:arylsulfatase A-like enzyme
MSTRRKFIQQGTAAAATAAMMGTRVFGETSATAPGTRPNIILILADDMGFSDIGCFGAEVETPNLDRLAAMGMRSSQWYNNPRCCPSRASIMTGLYAQQAGMGMMVGDGERYPYPEYAGDLSPHTCTIPEALKAAGYQTAMAGKWHLTSADPKGNKHNWPMQRGFDRFWGMITGTSVYYHPKVLVDGNTPLPEVTDPNFYLTDGWTDHAVKFVDEMSKEKAPYFLYLAYNCPHWPIQAPAETIAKYAKRYEEGWDKLREERHAKQLKMGLLDAKWAVTPRDPRVPAWPQAADKEWEMHRMAVYAAMIDKMDQGIGRVIKAVEDAGQMDNTLFVFMADNGGNAEELGPGGHKGAAYGGPEMKRGNDSSVMPGPADTFQSIGIPWGNCANTPFRLYKHYAHEGGISSPFIACWPKVIKPNVIEAALGHETDLMPTFLEVAGGTYPKSNAKGPIPAMVGESMVPVFEGKGRNRGPIFWEHEGNKAVRDGKWKLVSRFPDGWELHDMEADRTELHDLSHKEKDRVKKMEAMWNDWAKMVGAQPWPMPGTPKGDRTGDMPTPGYLKKRA